MRHDKLAVSTEYGASVLTAPVPSIRCAEEEVLQDDYHEVPQNDLAPEDGFVE